MRSVGAVLLASVASGCDKASPPPAGGEPGEVFREIAAEAGLRFEHFIGSTGQYFFAETAGAGVALFDYDGDGDLDIYLLQGAMLGEDKDASLSPFPPPTEHWPGNRLFRNDLDGEGNLRFTDVSVRSGVMHEGYGMGAAVGDYDNDGDPDLYVTNFGSNVLYRNEGDGTFRDVTGEAGVDDPRWSTSAAFADVDRDGDLDLFVTNYVDFTTAANKPCQGKGGERDYCGPLSYEPVPDRLFRNEGNGRFTDVSREAGLLSAFGSGLGVTCADFDRDGWVDIYVANDGRPNQLWLNRRDGRFEDNSLMSGTAYNAAGDAEASMGVTAGDFDNDGDEDLFMTHLNDETNTLYVNDGSGNFRDATARFDLGQPSTSLTGFGAAWFDYDNDGDLDLFTANGAVKAEEALLGTAYPYQQKNQLFRNEGGSGFTDVSSRAGAALELFEVSRGAAFGDIDNDGDIDIVVSNNNGPARVLLNEVGRRDHWLLVMLEGTRANRDGIGARVAVLREGRAPLWRRAHTDGSYLSASDVRVHFGLGADPAVDAVVVEWPGGAIETWRNVEAGGVVRLVEGTGERS